MGLSINYDCQCCTWQWHFREGWPLFKILNHGCSIFDNSKLVKLVIGTTHPPKNDKLEHTPKNEKCGTYPSSKKIKFKKNEKSVSHPSSNSCSLPSRHHRTSRRRAWSGHFLRQYQTIRSLDLIKLVVVVVVDIFWDKINQLDLRIWSEGDGDDYGRGSGGHFLRQDQSVESLNCNIIDQVDGDDYDRGSGGHFLWQNQSVESVHILSTAY